ncbi:hypothetical protein [Microbacterium gorillae]|uniref:hypothetical protein n=1 Tax=Microbacterium gorillae TaxID=1231063 RepID=UPI003D9945EE
MTDITISSAEYRSLFENSAAHFGEITARSLASSGHFIHPGDNIGRLLCQVWTVSPESAGLALAAYMVALNHECDRLDAPRPGLAKITSGLPLAINEIEFPNVDVAKMIATVTQEVPRYYSEAL